LPKRLSFFFCLLLLTVPAFAEMVPTYSPYLASPVIGIKYMVRLIFSLFVVIGLIVLAGRFLLPKLAPYRTGGGLIKVLERLSLEMQVAVYVLQLGDTVYLVGVGGNKQVVLLGTVDAKGLDLSQINEQAKAGLSFMDQLKNLLNKKEQ
jgi:flagellar biogenesis protein FliO